MGIDSWKPKPQKNERMSPGTHPDELEGLTELSPAETPDDLAELKALEKTAEGRAEIARRNAQSVAKGIDELPNVQRQEKPTTSKAEQLAALRAELEIARSVASEVDGRVPTTGPTEIERLEGQIKALEN